MSLEIGWKIAMAYSRKAQIAIKFENILRKQK